MKSNLLGLHARSESEPADLVEDSGPGEKRSRVPSLGEIGLQHYAPYLMNRIMGRYNAGLRDQLRDQNLSTPQMRTLAVLAIADGLTINELAVYTVIEQSTMSRTLDAMELQGLLRREASDTDSRTKHIYLTEAGRKLFADVWPSMYGAFQKLFAGVDDADYARFVSVLQTLLRNIRKHDF